MSDEEAHEAAQTKQEVSGIFGRAAATYDHVGPPIFSHFGRRLVQVANIPRGASVLDVASGRGALLLPATEAVGGEGRVVGIDLAEGMVQETAKEFARLGMPANLELRQMDAEHLQFPDGSFDCVLCGFAVFFFPKPYQAMSEFRRVLGPPGRIALSTWDKKFHDDWNWLDEMAKAYLPAKPQAARAAASAATPEPEFDTPEALQEFLRTAGLVDVRVIAEEAEFVYANEEEYWTTLWSHGQRKVLEGVEEAAGASGLEAFREGVLKKVASLKSADGIHHRFGALFAVASRPAD